MACAKYSGVITLGANAWQVCIDRDVGDDLNEALASCLAAFALVVDYTGMAGSFQLIGARIYANGITNTVSAHDLLPNALGDEEFCGHRGFMRNKRAHSLDHNLKHVRAHDVWSQNGEWLMERPEGTQAHSVEIGD
jgi:hypothetical protein